MRAIYWYCLVKQLSIMVTNRIQKILIHERFHVSKSYEQKQKFSSQNTALYDRIKVGEVGGGGGMQIMYPVGHTTQEQTLKVLV